MKQRIALLKSLMKAEPDQKAARLAREQALAAEARATREANRATAKPDPLSSVSAPANLGSITGGQSKPTTPVMPQAGQKIEARARPIEPSIRVKPNKTLSQQSANAKVNEANKEGWAPAGAQQSAVVPEQQGKKPVNPVILRQKMNEALTNITQQATPERGSFHQIGSYVLRAMKHLTHPKAGHTLNSNPEDYHIEASKWQGHPVLDMFDDVANKLYEGKPVSSPIKFKYPDAVLQPVLEDLANKKYPNYKHQIMGKYQFGKDSYAASEAGKNMLESLHMANEARHEGDSAGAAAHMAEAKKLAQTATSQRDSSGRALPPQTYGVANRLLQDIYDPNQLPAATQEIEQHFSGDPGLLTHYTNKALATHHLNQIDDEIDHIIKPIKDTVSGINWTKANLSPESNQKIQAQIKQALDFIDSKKIGPGGMLPTKAKVAKTRLVDALRNLKKKEEVQQPAPQPLTASVGSGPLGSNGAYMGQSIGERLRKTKEKLKGGLADGIPDSKFPKQALKQGMAVEREHSRDPQVQKEVSKDHLKEDPRYYSKLAVMEGEPKAQKRAR